MQLSSNSRHSPGSAVMLPNFEMFFFRVFNPERERDAVVIEFASQSRLSSDAAELRDVLPLGPIRKRAQGSCR